MNDSALNRPDVLDDDQLFAAPAVVLAAEAGDEILGAGAALHQMVKRGEGPLVIVFGAALAESAQSSNALASSGNDEHGSRVAGQLLGYGAPLFRRDLEDGVSYNEGLVQVILSLVQGYHAKRVYAPSTGEPRHDRLALGLAAREAVRRCGEACHLIGYAVEQDVDATHTLSDIDALAAKQRALGCFSGRGPQSDAMTSPRYDADPGHLESPQPGLATEAYQVTCPAQDIEPLVGMAQAMRWPDVSAPRPGPIVSIIIRTTGRDELETALDSVAVQTYRNIEVLLVDVLGQGALAVPSRCGELEIRVVSTGTPLNRGAAANVGIDAACGAYATFLDDDDWLHPDHISRLVETLQADDQYRAAYAGIDCRSRDGSNTWNRIKIFNDPYDPIRLLVENYIPMHAVLFDRRLFGPSLRFDESLPVYEDWDFWVQLSQLTPLHHVDRITAVYRISQTGGFGVRSADPAIATGTRLFFNKWRSRWTPDQFLALIEYQKRRVMLAEEAQQRHAAASKDNVLVAKLDLLETELRQAISRQDREMQARALIAEKYASTQRQLAEMRRKLAESSDEIASLPHEKETSERLRARMTVLNATASMWRRELGALRERHARVSSRLNAFQYGATWPITLRLHALESTAPILVRGAMRLLKAFWWAVSLQLRTRARQQSEARKILDCGLFDEAWYIDQNDDALLKGYRAIVHWMAIGRHRGDRPSSLFHTSWYACHAGLPADGVVDPLLHYVKRASAPPAEPNPLFDTAWYLSQVRDASRLSVSPLAHYLRHGWTEGLSPHPLFDCKWYLNRYPSLREHGLEPLSHYLEVGAYEGFDPHPLFQSKWYLETYPDVAEAAMNPLVHYLLHGSGEGRKPNPLFDSQWYTERNPEVGVQALNPLVHFVRYGAAEMRDPHDGFDLAAYRQTHEYLPADGVALLAHRLDALRESLEHDTPFGTEDVIDIELAGMEKRARPRDYLLWVRVNDYTRNRVAALAQAIQCVARPKRGELRVIKDFQGELDRVADVTFDLFDTLVERRVSEPADIFWLVGLRHYGRVQDAERYAVARLQAELDARRKATGPEVTMAQIMAELRQLLDLPDAEVSTLEQLELALEKNCITIKPEGAMLYDLAVATGKKVSILSDTYLPPDVIEEVIANAGYGAHESLYISNARNATKHDGSLFAEWLSDSDERAPQRTLHVGDNQHSDIASARAKGFHAFPVQPSRKTFCSHGFLARSWPDEVHGHLAWRLSLGLVVHRRSKLSAHTNSTAPYLGNPYLLGYATLGPLLLGFVSGLLDFATRRKTPELYFLSRDGFMLKAAYDEVAKALSESAPRSKYIAASRTLCSAASIDSVDEVLRIASVAHFPMSLAEMLETRFGLSREEIAEIPMDLYRKQGFSGPDEVIHEGDTRKEVFFEVVAPILINKSSGRANRYKAYLSDLNIREGGAVVDIGYAGTAQRVISRLLGRSIDGVYLITSERAGDLDRDGLHSQGWLAERAAFDHSFFEHVQLWEMFLSASHGSIVDVSLSEHGQPQFTFEDNLFAESVRGALAAIHRGAYEFVRDFMQRYGEHFSSLYFDPDAFARPLSEFFSDPDAADCGYLAPAVFEDKYGGDTRLLAAPVKPTLLDRKAIRRRLIWLQATRALSGTPVEPTPFYPVSPIGVARGRGWLQQSPAFVDRFDEEGIYPDWRADVYGAIFDSDGWPVCATPDTPLRLLLPTANSDVASHPVIDSWRQFVFSGTAITVAMLGDTCDSRRHAALEADLVDVVSVPELSGLIDAIEGAAEPWLLLNDGYTRLDPLTSAEILCCIHENPDVDVILFDDDWQGPDACRHSPHFKPGWSPELLLSTDYFGGAFAVRSALLEGVRTQSETASAWLWEIALLLTERTDRVIRIPRVLAHRSVDCYQRELPKAQREAERMVSDRFRRLGMPAEVTAPAWASHARRLACQPYFSDSGPEVAIIVPTRNQHAVTKRCIDSLARTTYRNYQIYLVDNESDDAEAIRYFSSLSDAGVHVLKIASPPEGFSYSFVNNRACELTADEPYLLFLNNDTEVINPRWLSQMMGWMRLPGVGSVGARLLFQNGTVQHAGITHRLLYNVLPAPSLKCEPADRGGYQDYLYLNRDSAAQTAACLLTSRDIFIEHGMFDEEDFGVAYNDCDFGFKLTQAGLRNVYCADAVLYHHEGYSRGIGRGNDKPREEAAFVRKYIHWEDPFYNPNLALGKTDFSLRPTSVVTGRASRLRVAVFSHNLNYEGAPRVLFEIGTGLQKSGEMHVLVMSPEEGALRAEYEGRGCAVHVMPEAKDAFRSDERGFNAVTEIAGRLVAERIDVVVANTVLCWWAVEAANMARVPSTWIIHESEPPFTHLAEHGSDCERRGRQALSLPYRVVFVAEATRAVFAHLETMNNFAVFHNGYDATSDHESALAMPKAQARTNLDIPPDTFVGLLPGSVIPRKSQIDLVHAVRKLDIDVLRDLHLIILGGRPNPYSETLHREIASLDPIRQQCLSVRPYSPGAEQYFRAADFMISTSRIEAFPRVVQEAMFFELPMIVAPVYGIVEQVTDEVSALFFPPGDATRLAEQIQRLLSSPSLRERLAENARVTLERFPTVAEMVSYYAETIRESWLSL